MIVVTTPMCKQIVEWAGLDDFKVNKHPDEEEGDLAILLSESKTEMDSLAIKLNTFSQIAQSIIAVSNCLYENNLVSEPISYDAVDSIFKSSEFKFADFFLENMDTIRIDNSNKNIKVYSEFLKDIVKDIGANVIEDSDFEDIGANVIGDSDFEDIGANVMESNHYDYVVYPDYLEEKVGSVEDLNDDSIHFIKLATHANVSKNPISRAEERYEILINALKD